MKISNKIFGMLFFVFLLVFAIFPLQSFANSAGSQPPNITSSVISSRTVAYMGNSVPGYISISIKTDKPSRGYIDVTGNNQSTRINLSTIDYKTEHTVNWVPWNDGQRQPLPPGVYTLRLNLWDEDLNSSQGYPLGTITVVDEQNPKPLIETGSPNPKIVTPVLAENKDLTNIEYTLNRHAEVQLSIQSDRVYYTGPKVKLAPGTHSVKWNGRDDQGNIVPDGEYQIVFNTIELNYNNPSSRANQQWYGSILVRDGEYGLPLYRIDEIVKEVKLDGNVISLNNTEKDSSINGSIVIAENSTVQVWIVNAAGVHFNNVMPQQQVTPGTYSFNWTGKDFFGGSGINGTYYVKVVVGDTQGNWAHKIYNNLSINLVDGYSYPLPEQGQRVRVIVPEANMSVYPMAQGYRAKEGEILTILDDDVFTTSGSQYSVLVAGQVPGHVNKHEVELIDLEKIPVKYGYVKKPEVRLESNPEFDYLTFEKATMGTSLRLLRKEGDWYRVLSPSGKQLYVRISDLSMEPISSSNNIHIVVQGDTLWKISQKYSTTIDEIVRVNNLNVNQHLTIGQKIQISSAPNEDTQNTNNTYIVKAGDTLWKIAVAHNTTVNEIVALNKLNTADHLYIGQKLTLQVAPSNDSNQTASYTVKAGDTLWKIAGANNTTVNEIVALNKLNPADHLYIGQKLDLPTAQSNDSNQTLIYTVKAGDSLWKIAQSHNTTVDKMAKLNNLNPNQPIFVGQQIKII